MDERKSKQRGSESGKETEQSVEWTAQRKSKAQAEDKGESEEASAGIESDGRQKEIADETFRQAVGEAARPKPQLDGSGDIEKTASTEKSGLFCFM